MTTSKRINKKLAKKLIFPSLEVAMRPFSPAAGEKYTRATSGCVCLDLNRRHGDSGRARPWPPV
ncbi:hypothetical protein, partial [Herbaspirillum lusitanum]|uniref:hypothetical protein n=1 Tax=Herbaspirillum lusitanum TaxID=213312 RepID=UPI001EE68BCA